MERDGAGGRSDVGCVYVDVTGCQYVYARVGGGGVISVEVRVGLSVGMRGLG